MIPFVELSFSYFTGQDKIHASTWKIGYDGELLLNFIHTSGGTDELIMKKKIKFVLFCTLLKHNFNSKRWQFRLTYRVHSFGGQFHREKYEKV